MKSKQGDWRDLHDAWSAGVGYVECVCEWFGYSRNCPECRGVPELSEQDRWIRAECPALRAGTPCLKELIFSSAQAVLETLPADLLDEQLVTERLSLHMITEKIKKFRYRSAVAAAGQSKFIEAAAAGRGDARALADPEVREFIERHDLWNLLVVSFRT